MLGVSRRCYWLSPATERLTIMTLKCMNRLSVNTDISTLHLIHAHAERGSLLSWFGDDNNKFELTETIEFSDDSLTIDFCSENPIIDAIKGVQLEELKDVELSVSYVEPSTRLAGRANVKYPILLLSRYNLQQCKSVEEVLANALDDSFIADIMDLFVFSK